MTREEVEMLTDEQLRIKAAELLGAKWYVDREYLGNGRFLAFLQEPEWDEAKGDEHTNNALWYIPDYLHDMRAAWGVWQDYIEGQRSITLYTSIEGVRLAKIEMWPDQDEVFKYLYSITGIESKNLLREITRAFVIAKTEGSYEKT